MSKTFNDIGLDDSGKNLVKEDFHIYPIPINEFFQSAFSVDCVVFGFDKDGLKILLIQRDAQPFKDAWALPGDLIFPNEDLEDGANRVLNDLTGLDGLFMEQSHTFGSVGRHPLGRVLTVAYYALVSIEHYNPKSSSWAKNAHWHPMEDLPELAFDHGEIICKSLEVLRAKVRHQPVGFELLPPTFPLGALQKLYEVLLSKQFDKANFRKKILSMNLLVDTGKQEKDVPHRPGRLYSFDEARYEELISRGFSFEL